MIQKLIAYALLAAVLAILQFSTARIGLAILSETNVPDVFDVHLDDNEANLVYVPILPINQRKLAVSKGETGPGGVSDTLPRLVQMSSQRRNVDAKDLRYKCGVIMYDHYIPGEGGDSLDEWIKELVESNDGASFVSSGKQESKESFLKEVERGIGGVGPNEWKIIYSRRNGLAFGMDENILRSWRDIAEEGSCHFVAAAVFSDPLDHSIQHTKKLFAECQCTMVEFKEKMKDIMEENPWTGQLDNFLFNSKGLSLMETKGKVKKGMQLLRDHFELVMVDGQADFAGEILHITGWNSTKQVKKASVSNGDLVYSKDLISNYGKMSTENGDVDFIDAVNHVYHNNLGYLMLQ